MTPTNQRPASATWPWGRLLLVLAALLLIRGIGLTRTEPSMQTWEYQGGQQYLAFDPHGALIVGSSATLNWYDPTNWSDPPTSTPDATLQADGEITSFAISPDGQWVATGTNNGTLTLWTSAPTWRAVETLQLTPPGGEMRPSPISVSALMGVVCAGWLLPARQMGQKRSAFGSGNG